MRYTPWRSAIALTFDDGPNPAFTPQLLALLERHEARATFFLVGRFARACPELVRETAARGHTIGNHTETHPNLAWLSGSRIEEELARCRESIAEAIGSNATDLPAGQNWMRPPFGYRGPQLEGAVIRAGLSGVVMWSIKCYDWKPQPTARLIERLGRAAVPRDRGRGGNIVLLHDGDFRHLGADRQHVLVALKYWLPRWRDAGLKFVTMDEVADGTLGAA